LGVFNISLKWNTIDDLDLRVKESDGNEISYRKVKSKTSGGKLDVDANSGDVGTTLNRKPIENITWTDQVPSRGKLIVFVDGYKRNTTSTEPVPYEIVITKKGREIEKTIKETQLPKDSYEDPVKTQVLIIPAG
jgi:uncharacterized protein YfaP (DUF2135 family)